MATKNTQNETAIANALPADKMAMANAQASANAALVNLADALDCRRIVTGTDAVIIVKSADKFADVGALAKAKALARAKAIKDDNGAHVWTMEGLKTFEQWAEKFCGVKASQAQNYVKAAAYIDECGTRTPFDRGGHRYTVAAIIAVIEAKGAKNADAIRKALADEVSPAMTVAEIKRKYKHELTEKDGAKVTDTTPASDEPNKDTATPTAGAQTAKDALKQPEKVGNTNPLSERITIARNIGNGCALALDIPVPAGAIVTIAYGGKVYTYTVKLAE